GELRANPAAGGWINTTGRNLALNHLTRYRRRLRFFSELGEKDDAEKDDEETVVDFPSPDCFVDDIDNSQRREILQQALQRLPDHQRISLVLFVFEQLPYAEIAQSLGITHKKVRNDIYLARRALGKQLADLRHE